MGGETVSDEAAQYLHVARRYVSALQIQHDRAMSGADLASHDAELYAIVLANYAALLYRAGGRRKDEPSALHPDLAQLSIEFDQRFADLRRFRNWHGHPPFPDAMSDEVTWTMFSNGPYVLLTDGGARPIVDVEMDHDYVLDVQRQVEASLAGP